MYSNWVWKRKFFNVTNYKLLEKVEVYESLDDISNDEIEGNLDEFIERLNNLKSDRFTRYVIADNSNYDGEDSYGAIEIKGIRLETDEEFQERMDLVAQDQLEEYNAQQKKELDQRKLYEELKQRFENEKVV